MKMQNIDSVVIVHLRIDCLLQSQNGLDIMRANGMTPNIIRAGKANLFLSPVFCDVFVNATGTAVELYSSDGSVGAAIGAGIGIGYFKNSSEAFANRQVVNIIQPSQTTLYNDLYENWKAVLEKQLHSV